MYPRDAKDEGVAGAGSSFGNGFLGAMDDELEALETEEEGGLPLIEEDVLPAGKYQNVILEEASLDEPLPGMDKVYNPREEEWDYSTADFHGKYEEVAKRQHAASVAEPKLLPADVYEPEEDEDDPLATLEAIAGIAPEPALYVEDGSEDQFVDTERAFDEIEDQDDDDYDEIAGILANIDGGSADGDDSDFETETLETNFRINSDDEELMQGFEIDEIISLAIEMKASDIHINPNQRIRFRINGSITSIMRFDPIPGEITRRIQQKIVTNVADDIFLENWELDTSYTVKSGPHRGRRVRVVVVKTFEEIAMVMRIISQDIPLPHELEIEDELLEWSELPNGLVLMNGPTGTGKSTTLASIIQNIQMRLDGVIITVEKPVEYMYKEQGRATVYQREVGRDTLSFGAALDSAMRMDPDVILIGEMRNAVEANAVIYAADTGHLSLSTTHANSAASTVSRIKKMFEGDERRQAMESLASVSRGFASQVLCKTVDGAGRFAVREILSITEPIADLIIQGDDRGIRKLQEAQGITLDHGLVKAVLQGRCTREEARSKSPSPRYFDALLAEAPRPL